MRSNSLSLSGNFHFDFLNEWIDPQFQNWGKNEEKKKEKKNLSDSFLFASSSIFEAEQFWGPDLFCLFSGPAIWMEIFRKATLRMMTKTTIKKQKILHFSFSFYGLASGNVKNHWLHTERFFVI